MKIIKNIKYLHKPIQIFRDDLGIQLYSQHGEQFRGETIFNHITTIKFNTTMNGDFIFSKKEVRIPLENKFQDITVVDSRVTFFRDLEVNFFAFLNTTIFHLK